MHGWQREGSVGHQLQIVGTARIENGCLGRILGAAHHNPVEKTLPHQFRKATNMTDRLTFINRFCRTRDDCALMALVAAAVPPTFTWAARGTDASRLGDMPSPLSFAA